MTLKIFHTADLHLGLQFRSYPESVAKKLKDARFETLSRMVQIANAERCQLFVVCGDMFDTTQIAKKYVTQAAKILNEFEGVVLVLPGNHDYITGAADELWSSFREASHDRVCLLSEAKVYSLKPFEMDACIYPAPCQNKHSKTHALAWLQDLPKDPAVLYHIGLAHGSFEGLSPDTEGEYYPMKKVDLTRCGLDLWLMGHIHIQFPSSPGEADRIFYPATPEPDGFDCRHEGKAWLIEITPEKRIDARSVSTGSHRFVHKKMRIESKADLDLLKVQLSDPAYRNTLFKLSLEGSVRKDEYAALAGTLQSLKEQLLFLKTDDSLVSIKLTPDDIDAEFASLSFPHELLKELSQAEADSEALQIAYELIRDLNKIGQTVN